MSIRNINVKYVKHLSRIHLFSLSHP